MLLLVIFLLVCWPASVCADEVKFVGEPPHDGKMLGNGINFLLRQGLDIEAISDSVLGWLSRDGYLDAGIDIDSNRISITAGRRFILDKLVVAGDSTVVYPNGDVFIEENIDRAVQAVLEKYYDRGFYYTRANIISVKREENRVTLELELLKGPLVTVGKNILRGLTRTRPDIVRKYLPIRDGDTLTGETVRRAENAAAAVPFVDFRPPVTVRAESGFNQADLVFDFVEKRQFAFNGGAGYIPDDPSGLVWNMDLTLSNLFGDGRRLRVYSERKKKGRNILDLSYSQPVFLLGLGEADFKVATRDYRDQFYEFALDGAYRTALKPGFITGLSLSWKRVEPSTINPAYSRFTAGFLLERRSLDSDYNPANGYVVNWTIAFAYRKYDEDTLMTWEAVSYNETRTEVAADYYRKLFGSLVFHVGVNYRGLETGEALPALAELYFVGGPGTIRGFRNEQFSARRTAFGTLEPRWRFSNGYMFLFYDAAYLNRHLAAGDDRVATEELYRYGYGFGLALNDSQRSLKVALGWNRDMPLNQPRLSIELSSDI
ncbi:MAG: BamA/TamA family outer membrane protein [Candidatus Zixiibacteriota bacterium]